MKHSRAVHLGWAAACLAAFAVGSYQKAETTHEAREPASSAGAGASPAKADRASDSADPRLASPATDSATPVSPQAAGARAFEVLSEPNPSRRMRAFCDLLDHLTADNAVAIKDAFVQQTIHEGRTHDSEWRMFWVRYGEVAGAAVIDREWDFGSGSSRRNAGYSLAGWAESDAKAALSWFQAQPPEKQDTLWSSFFNGYSRTDSKAALRLMFEQPRQVWESTMTAVLQGAFDQGGFRAAEELIDEIYTRPDVNPHLKRNVVYQVGQRRMNSARLSGDPAAPLAWFERFIAPDSPIGPAITGEIVAQASRANPQATFAWVQQREARMPQEQASAAYAAAALALQRAAPQELSAWLDSNPAHPYRQDVLKALEENTPAAAGAVTK